MAAAAVVVAVATEVVATQVAEVAMEVGAAMADAEPSPLTDTPRLICCGKFACVVALLALNQQLSKFSSQEHHL